MLRDPMGSDDRDVVDRLATASSDDLLRDPRSFGMPTLQEFMASPDKYRKSADQLLRAADQGSKTLKDLKEHRYYFEGIACGSSLEEVERVARNEGVAIDTLEMRTGLEKIGAGKFRAHVFFHRKGWSMENQPDVS